MYVRLFASWMNKWTDVVRVMVFVFWVSGLDSVAMGKSTYECLLEDTVGNHHLGQPGQVSPSGFGENGGIFGGESAQDIFNCCTISSRKHANEVFKNVLFSVESRSQLADGSRGK